MRNAFSNAALFLVFSLLVLSIASYAQNQVLGEVQFVSKANVEKTSGVWIDGQYVGYVGELKDDKKVLLLPGEHLKSRTRKRDPETFAQTAKAFYRAVARQRPRLQLPSGHPLQPLWDPPKSPLLTRVDYWFRKLHCVRQPFGAGKPTSA